MDRAAPIHLSLPVRLTVGILGCIALCGCSNFDAQWRDAGAPKPGSIEGRWQGAWKSQQDGHTGELRCVVHQSAGQNYDAYFNATFAGIFHFSYDAKLTGRVEGDGVVLTGQQNLGWPVGIYHYQGTADAGQFYCAYRSDGDHGYFSLARPGGTPPSHPLSLGGSSAPAAPAAPELQPTFVAPPGK